MAAVALDHTMSRADVLNRSGPQATPLMPPSAGGLRGSVLVLCDLIGLAKGCL